VGTRAILDTVVKRKIPTDRLYSELSEEMEGTGEHKEYRKNLKTNFTLST
jgi:hypothetical protein